MTVGVKISMAMWLHENGREWDSEKLIFVGLVRVRYENDCI